MNGLRLAAVIALAAVSLRAAEPRSLHTEVLAEGIGLAAEHGPGALRAEAGRAAAWVAGRDSVSLRRDGENWRLASGSESLPLSEDFGRALDRLNRYFGMTAETLARPVAPQELEAALLSPAGVASVRGLFEEMIAARLVLGGKVLVPEIGGEATLGAGLEFHRVADPVRPLFPLLAGAIDDPGALARLYRDHPQEMGIIDEHGLLSGFLKRLPLYADRAAPSPERLREVQRLTVTTLLENSADAYVMEPAAQLDAILTQDWSGRYAGWWHTHPPGFAADGWRAADVPSGPDMDIAVKRGQNLTIAFHPEGFTAYDLSALADSPNTGLSAVRTITYRSGEWRDRFSSLHSLVAAGLSGS